MESVATSDPRAPLSVALEATIDDIGTSTVTLRRLFELLGEQGLLFLCVILSLPFLAPVSIPGVSTVFGFAIILVGLAVAANRVPWAPGRLLDRELDGAKLGVALRRGVALVRRADRLLRPRLSRLVVGPGRERLNGLGLAFGGVLLMFPLGFVPFSNTLPGLGVISLASGMLQRDGAAVAVGWALMAGSTLYFTTLGWLALRAGAGLLG